MLPNRRLIKFPAAHVDRFENLKILLGWILIVQEYAPGRGLSLHMNWHKRNTTALVAPDTRSRCRICGKLANSPSSLSMCEKSHLKWYYSVCLVLLKWPWCLHNKFIKSSSIEFLYSKSTLPRPPIPSPYYNLHKWSWISSQLWTNQQFIGYSKFYTP